MAMQGVTKVGDMSIPIMLQHDDNGGRSVWESNQWTGRMEIQGDMMVEYSPSLESSVP